MKIDRRTLAALLTLAVFVTVPSVRAQVMNPLEVSGIPLPVNDVPAGTVSVRVVKGAFVNQAGVVVEFTINGDVRKETTDASGRAQVSGLASGVRVKAAAVVDGKRLESQEFSVSASGVRVLLAAPDASTPVPATTTAVKGTVVLGPETRVVAEFSDERLNIFYAVQILNNAQTPVDIGGPILIDLPTEARGASIMDGSTKQATANGPRITVLGPFAPGATMVDVAYEMPYSTGTVRLTQVWPVPLQQVMMLIPQQGGFDITSAQAPNKQVLQSNGVPVVVATGPTLAAGQPLVIDISGLPHHATWPRNVALTLAGMFVSIGLWAAFVSSPRRRVA